MTNGVKSACLLGAVLALTAAGCGGGKATAQQPTTTATTTSQKVSLGKAAYDRTMKQLGTQLVGSVEGLFPLVEAQPGSDASKASLVKLEKTRSVVTRVMTKVAGIAPPAPIRAEHQRLLQGIASLGGELDMLIQVEQEGTTKPFGTFARFDSLRTIAKARSAIVKKGYAIG